MNSELNFLQLILKNIREIPDQPAIRFNNIEMTHRQLDQQSNQIASALKENYDIPTGDVIAIDLSSPLEILPAVLGIKKAGLVYLPINPLYPSDYNKESIQDNHVKYILSNRETYDFKFTGEFLPFSNILKNGPKSLPEIPERINQDTFYVYFGEYTMGRPCGFDISNPMIFNWLNFNINVLKIDFSHLLFISTANQELIVPLWIASLIEGGEVSFFKVKKSFDIEELKRQISDHPIKSIVMPLSFIKDLIKRDQYKNLNFEKIVNIVSFGEETFEANAFKRFLKESNTRWHNYFGFPGFQMISSLVNGGPNDELIYKHLGLMASENKAYILDKAQQPVSVGVEGDLYVSGKGVLNAYFKNNHLNENRFINPSQISNEKLFKTGYRGYWMQDGKISLLEKSSSGGIDGELKITCQDVESILYRHSNIQDCAVVNSLVNFSNVSTEPGILIYLVLKEECSIRQIEDYLKAYLPDILFPLGFIILHSLPRDASGVMDEKFLKTLKLMDSRLAKQKEMEIAQLPEIKEVGIIVKEMIDKPEPLYLEDFKFRGTVSNHLSDDNQNNKSQQEILLESDGKTSLEVENEKEPEKMALVSGGELECTGKDPQTLIDVLKYAVDNFPCQEMITLQEKNVENLVTYAELLEDAEKILTGLLKMGLKPKDKVIFQFDRISDYFSMFWGCTLAGIVPVPLAVPKSYQEDDNETRAVKNIWEMLEKPVILTSKFLGQSIHHLCDDFKIAEIEDLRDNPACKIYHPPDPEDMAIILFTSGSTGKPKGVIQCHRNIIAREKSTAVFYQLSETDVSLNWLPVEHVVGILMFHIKEIYLGCKQIHTQTDLVLADPLFWLELISRYQVTMTWAPNFAYSLATDALEREGNKNWDLSSLKLISNAGETVNADTTKKFLKMLEPNGLPINAMKPEWGMSETCSCVLGLKDYSVEEDQGVFRLAKDSLNDVLRIAKPGEDYVSFVNLGIPYPGTAFRIVDNNSAILTEKRIGRLQIKGNTVTPGYYQNPEINKEVFVGDGWFDTGDLAFIFDGQVTFAGRVKDVIIINGINYNNNEIETAVEEIEGVETSFTVACAVQNPDENNGTDQLAIFFHSTYPDFKQVMALIKKIRSSIAEKIGVDAQYIIPVNKEEIPKTSIGKLQRSKIVKKFSTGYFKDILRKIDIASENENTLPSWFFKKTWSLKAPSNIEAFHENTCCYIFMDSTILGDELANQFKDEHIHVIKIRSGEKFRKIDDDYFELNPLNPRDYQRLFSTVEDIHLNRAKGDIFYLDTSPGTGEKTGKLENIEAEIQQRMVPLINLIQALPKGNQQTRHLYIITENSQMITCDKDFCIERGLMPGFIKCISMEMPWLKTCHLDLAGEQISNDIPHIIKEWKSAVDEPEVVFRDNQRFVPYLNPVDMKEEVREEIPLKEKGVFLITGGLGGIGLILSKWLIKNFQARLIIIGRTTFPGKNTWKQPLENDSHLNGKIHRYLELEATGAEFIYKAGDIANPLFLKEVVSQGEKRWGKSISGIFHLAGIGNLTEHWNNIEERWLSSLSYDTLNSMFRAKIFGTINLHNLLKNRPDTVFIAFSSILGFFGAPSFSAYSAANRFLDYFCQYRIQMGYSNTFCLNWSYWENLGMSKDFNSQDDNQLGFEKISPLQGLHSLALILRCVPGQYYIGLDPSQANILKYLPPRKKICQAIHLFYSTPTKVQRSNIEFSKTLTHMILPGEKTGAPLLELHFLESLPKKGDVIDYELLNAQTIMKQSASALYEKPNTEIEEKLVEIWEEVLNKRHIGVHDNFFELGGHSLKTIKMVSMIQNQWDIEITLNEVFKKRTLRNIASLIESKQESGGGVKGSFPIPVEKKEYYPQSSAQKSLYFLDQLENIGTSYNMPIVLQLKGLPDIQYLEKIFLKLIERHEVLRSSFLLMDNQPVQLILNLPQINFSIQIIQSNMTGLDKNEIKKIIGEFIMPFELAKAPLFRVGIARITGEEYLLMVDIHHIICDGTSLAVFHKDFFNLYQGEKLSPMKLQYRDFSSYQDQLLRKGKIKKQEKYWMDCFSGEIPRLNLATDFPRPTFFDFRGDAYSFYLEGEHHTGLKNISQKEGTTLFMNLLTSLYILLYKYTGQEDIIIGATSFGRNYAGLEHIVGMFVNELPLRNYPSDKKTFLELLREVKESTIQAFDNQDVQFESLVRELKLVRDPSRNPLFDVCLTLQNWREPIQLPSHKGENQEKIGMIAETAKFDLHLFVNEVGDQLSFILEYSSVLFKKSTIEIMANRFLEILKQVNKNNEIKLKDIIISHDVYDGKLNLPSADSGDFKF